MYLKRLFVVIEWIKQVLKCLRVRVIFKFIDLETMAYKLQQEGRGKIHATLCDLQ